MPAWSELVVTGASSGGRPAMARTWPRIERRFILARRRPPRGAESSLPEVLLRAPANDVLHEQVCRPHAVHASLLRRSVRFVHDERLDRDDDALRTHALRSQAFDARFNGATQRLLGLAMPEDGVSERVTHAIADRNSHGKRCRANGRQHGAATPTKASGVASSAVLESCAAIAGLVAPRAF